MSRENENKPEEKGKAEEKGTDSAKQGGGFGGFLSGLFDNYVGGDGKAKLPAIIGGGLLAILGAMLGGLPGLVIGMIAAVALGGVMNGVVDSLSDRSAKPQPMNKPEPKVDARSTTVDVGQGANVTLNVPVPDAPAPTASAAQMINDFTRQTNQGIKLAGEKRTEEAQIAFREAAESRDTIMQQIATGLRYDEMARVEQARRPENIRTLSQQMIAQASFRPDGTQTARIAQVAESVVPNLPTLSDNTRQMLTQSGVSLPIQDTNTAFSLDSEATRAAAIANKNQPKERLINVGSLDNYSKLILVQNQTSQEVARLEREIDWDKVEKQLINSKWMFATTRGRAEAIHLKDNIGGELQQRIILGQNIGELDRESFDQLRELYTRRRLLEATQARVQTFQPAVDEVFALNQRARENNPREMERFAANMAQFRSTGNLNSAMVERPADDSPNNQPSVLVENYNARTGQTVTAVVSRSNGTLTHTYQGKAEDTPTSWAGEAWASNVSGNLSAAPINGVKADDLINPKANAQARARNYGAVMAVVQSGTAENPALATATTSVPEPTAAVRDALGASPAPASGVALAAGNANNAGLPTAARPGNDGRKPAASAPPM